MIDPELDLTLHRVIRASRQRIWDAWTRPELFAKWWTPAPTVTRVDRLEAKPGGALVTRMSEDGTTFVPHMDAVFLVADTYERLVFTNAVDSSWRPAEPAPVPMTAEIALTEHADGTEYNVVVRHRSPSDRDRHDELGFYNGWGSVTAALADLVEHEAPQ